MTVRQIHIIKAFSWRFIASLATLTITWIVTGSLDLGIKVGLLDVVVKLVLYYLHERAWFFGAERRTVLEESAS